MVRIVVMGSTGFAGLFCLTGHLVVIHDTHVTGTSAAGMAAGG